MIRLIIFVVSTLALTDIAGAEELVPGMWELSLEARVDADPGFQPTPITVNQCFTGNDASDPSKVLKPITTAGAPDCDYTAKSYVGDSFHFTMQCSGSLDMQTTGEVTFSATTLRGTITTSTSIDGNRVEIKSALVGHRVGDC